MNFLANNFDYGDRKLEKCYYEKSSSAFAPHPVSPHCPPENTGVKSSVPLDYYGPGIGPLSAGKMMPYDGGFCYVFQPQSELSAMVWR